MKEEGEKWVYRLFFFSFYRDENFFINLYRLLLLERAVSVLVLISVLGVLRALINKGVGIF